MLGRRRKRTAAFRCFFATDIHGSDRCFRKFLAAAQVYQANALILGGDIAGKAIVPIVSNGNGSYHYTFQGADRQVSREQLSEIVEKVKFNGLYPHVCDANEHEQIAADERYQHQLFERLIIGQIEAWEQLIEQRLSDGVQCVITPGNDDPLAIDAVLEQAERIECPERRVFELGPVLLASLGNTNRTPWNTDREYDEPELGRQIDDMLRGYSSTDPLMFNFHCPPFDSTLDRVVELDENLAPVISRGTPVEVPVGSTAVKAAIERYQPTVALHGHIHEAAGAQRIGSTVCINPGSDYSSGFLKGAIVDLDENGGYVEHLLTSG
jgi:Icc-related predicted phosphoesterase